MAAGDVSDALETRVRDLAGDNSASFTQARIMSWMEEAQMDIARRLPAEALPEMQKQTTSTLTAQGTAPIPSDFIRLVLLRYATTGKPAAYKSPQVWQLNAQNSYLAATGTEPEFTVMARQFIFNPIAPCAYQIDYLAKSCPAISTTQDPEIPVRYQDALVFYAASKCEERQKAFDEANVHMSQYERCVALWGGTPK